MGLASESLSSDRRGDVMGMGDTAYAGAFRDTIERIATGVINKIRPAPFMARVYDLDLNEQKARVVRAGEKVSDGNLMSVQFAQDKIPSITMGTTYATLGEDAPGNIVRVAGEPGAYYILDYFSGAPLNVVSDNRNEALHANPSFEDPLFVNGVPNGWLYASNLYGGTWSMSLDSIDRVHGNFALKIDHRSGSTTKLVNSASFPVQNGDIIKIGSWIKSSGAGSVLNLNLHTATTDAGAQPGGSGVNSQTKLYFIGVNWIEYTTEFNVPAGHLFARIEFTPGTLLSTDFTYWLDGSTSRRIFYVPWINIDGSAFFNPVGNLFVNSWVNFGGSHQTAQFRKVGDMVQLRGLIKLGTMNAAAFVLPAGFRPPNDLVLAQIEGANSIGRLDIRSDGSVVPTTGTNSFFGINAQFSTT